MIPFRCHPIPTETARRFRETRRDDRGEAVHVRISADSGMPCRHCLRNARPGEEMLLGAFELPRPRGVYWTPSPIFVHATPCEAFDRPNEIVETVRTSLVSLRSYGADDMILYDLGVVVDGREADPLLERALADPRTAYVNVHTARPGCLLCTVTRA